MRAKIEGVKYCLLLLLLSSAFSAEKKPVTLETVANHTPSATIQPIWSPDGKSFLYQQGGKIFLFESSARKSREIIELLRLESSAQKPPASKLFDWQNRRVTENVLQWMPDGRHAIVVAHADIFRLDTRSKKWEQITSTPVAERDVKLSPDGKKISYRIEHDLYALDLATKKQIRLTHDGNQNILNGELDWVYPEELDLGTAYWWSPDSSSLAYLQFDTTRLTTYPHADLNEVLAYAEPQKYPRAGTENSEVRLGIVKADGGETRWMDLGDTRNYLLARIDWVPDTRSIFVQRMTRIQDRLDLISVESNTGKSQVLLTEKDPHWVNIGDHLRFLPSSSQFVWASERSGFRHLYLYGMDGTMLRQLTQGDWEVSDVHGVSSVNGNVFYTSTQTSPLERQLYRVDLAGGTPQLLSSGSGTHLISMNGQADLYLDTHSSLSESPAANVRRVDGSVVANLVSRDQKAAEEHSFQPVEIVKVPSGDGDTLYARLIKPVGFQEGKKYPAVVMVYGGPHVQFVKNSWMGLNWEQALANQGFVIWALDNRGSIGRGHAWESKIHRRFGNWELKDQRTGVEYLTKLGFVDPARIGMYGWSYGGYMTLYSLMNAPDLFAAGISGAPVVRWNLYDTIYTERYLGLPQENEAGYREGSAIEYVRNLKAPLLLIHNYGDDNVLFQNFFQMADALQKHNKQFEMMLYPQKAHGVTGPARLHLNQLMTDFFIRHLRPGN